MPEHPPSTAELDYRAIFESTPTPYLVLSPDLIVVAVNDAYLQATRTERSALIGRHMFDAFPDNPADPGASGVANLRESLLRVLQSREADVMAVQKYDIRVPAADGVRFEEHYWSPINTPVLDAAGDVTCIIHRVRDVTAFVAVRQRRSELEEEVASQAQEVQAANERLRRTNLELDLQVLLNRQQKERLRTLLMAVPVPVAVVVGNEHRLLLQNDAHRALLGGADRTGHAFADAAPGVARELGSALDQVLHGGEPLRIARQPLSWAAQGGADGAPRYFDVFLHRFGENLGETEGVVIAAADVTAHVEADRRKDEFLATLAHELRNPLAPILNGVEVLRMTAGSAEIRTRMLDTIARQVSHMVRLVDDLLDVARINSGKIQLRCEVLDLRDILDAALEAGRPAIEAAGHELIHHAPSAPVRLRGDPVRLTQVIANVLNNASKYTSRGGTIEVAATVDDAHAIIRVSDTGVGIPAEMLPRVFDLFTQADDAMARTQGGLGLGLAVSRRLVEMHDGRMEAASAGRGRGSTFTVWLPLLQDRSETTEAAADTDHRVTPPQRVLVVDDNVDAARMLGEMIETLGHQPSVATSGEEAVKLARQIRPATVFCDIGMPGTNGLEVARQLRADPRTSQAMLIALTGWGSHSDRQRALQAGFDVHVAKPIGAEAIRSLLAQAGGRHH